MRAPLAVDALGQALTGFDRGRELTGTEHQGNPCPLALVVLASEGDILLGLNRWRRSWELPGGLVEEGETPRQAARRELREETGVSLSADRLHWAGLATFELVDPVRTELAAVFAATVDGRAETTPSDGLTDLGWFDPDAPPDGHAPLDLAISRIVLGRPFV